MPFLKEEKSEHERARTSMLAVQLCCARHCELPLSKMGNKGLFPGVAVPLAFFGTFFRFERKYCPPWGGRPTVRAGVGASIPAQGELLTAKLSSIDASRVAFRSPPCTPFGPHSARKPQGKQSGKNMRGFLGANNRRVRPHREHGIALAGALGAFLKANHQRGPHCRALHQPFAATTRRGCPQK